MVIKSLNSARLRSEEHFNFQAGFYNLINTHKAASLGITPLFTKYKPLYETEKSALDSIKKNKLTAVIKQSDESRDIIFRGLSDLISIHCTHFDEEIKKAAGDIDEILEHYGKVTRKNYEAKTAAIFDLISEINTNYTEQVKLTDAKVWIDQLKKENTNFQSLQDQRYTAEAKATNVTMTDARAAVDGAYREIINLVNALALVNGETKYRLFIKELNKRIESFNLIVNRRNSKDKSSDTDVIVLDDI